MTPLLYICCSPQATTVFQVTFDDDFWQMVWDSASHIFSYDEPQKPKGKSDMAQHISDRITIFRNNNVKLLAEFPSSTALTCSHSDSTRDGQVSFGEHTNGHRKITVVEAEQALYRARTSMEEAYTLLRLPAKEVVVALITDLDRIKQTDIPHAIPISYGLAGYSTTTDTIFL